MTRKEEFGSMSPSRSEILSMTEEEVTAFLQRHWMMVIGTTNPDGTPHLVTMGYAVDEGGLIFTAYQKSQKTRNLTRDPRISCLIEDPGEAYAEVQGVLLYGQVEMTTDLDTIVDYLRRISGRIGSFGREVEPVESQDFHKVGAKRVGVKVRVDRTVSWDHRRLNGRY